ncbi:MAG: metallophosphoesterase [Eubacteriales bacterium]
MSIYSIGDLHLSLSMDKPMDVFGKQWENHVSKIESAWVKTITKDDIVLVSGDTSWAVKFKEAEKDLKYLQDLPGKKLLIKGNHDYWWQSIKKMQGVYSDINFIQNNSFIYNDNIGICGTRGWVCPGSKFYSKEKDEKIYLREVNRLRLSLQSLPSHIKEIIAVLHYPPTNENLERSGFIELIEEYSVKHVIYGHLHGEESFDLSIKGQYNDIKYHLVSADYLDFNPKLIIDN